MNPLFKLLGVDDVYLEFDKKVKTLGWWNGCGWLIDSLRIQYKFEKNIVPTKGPVIIYANHPTGVDPYLLIAAFGREDSYFWGDVYQSKKGKGISKYIIPIAPKPILSILRRPLTNWPGYIYMRLTTPSLTREKTKRINKKSIEKTIELLKKGNQVIIFPSGGEYEFLKPAKGLSIIIEKCKYQKIPIRVVKVNIKNFGELSLLFHFIFKTKIEAKIATDFTI